MVGVLKKENKSVILYLVIAVLHTFTMFAKTNYAASVAYIVSRGIFSKTNAGTVASLFYLLYGFGQIVGGRLVDKFSPYKMICIGLIGAIVGNLVLSFTNNYFIVLISWSLCGVLQFGIYPGICKIISTDVLPKHRDNATMFINYASQISGILSYIFAAIVLENFGWSAMFLSSVTSLIITLILWLYVIYLKPQTINEDLGTETKINLNIKPKNKFGYYLISFGIIFIIFLSFMFTMLLNGAELWIPTMVMESYEGISSGFSSSVAILLFVVRFIALLIFKPVLFKFKNPIVGAMCMYILSLIPLTFLQFVGEIHYVVIVAMLCLQSALLRLTDVILMRVTYTFAKFGLSGTFSGIRNSLAAFGIVVASYGYGALSEYFGWLAVTITWLIITILGILFCIFPAIKWKKFEELSNS